MSRFSWSGLPTLPWSHGANPVEGLVLSGGGSKVSFQLGALRYLYEVVGIRPSVVVGTSSGSILSAMIGQSTDPEEQAAGVRQLEGLLYELRRQSDMFTERPWFTTLQARGQEWVALLSTERPMPSAPKLGATRKRATDDDPPLADEEQLSGQAETLRIAMAENTPETSGWSPSVVMQLMSSLPRLRGAPSDLGTILRGAEATRSMYRPGPLLERLLDEQTYRSDKVASSGMTVRISTVCLESGELRFMRQDGRLVDRDDEVVGHEVHDFSRGVLASCSIPAVFAPVELEGEYYVDGGVRENIPAEMAAKLGVDRCWVVSSAAVDNPPKHSFAVSSIALIASRATEIMADEIERDEIAYARSAGMRVIEPEVPVHQPLQVDPGLIRINRDYGWMRAAEAHLDVPLAQRNTHRRLIELRCEAHRLEAEHFVRRRGERSRPTEDQLRALTAVKLEIADAIGHARHEALPEGHERWASEWEQHPSQPTRRPPWLSAAGRRS
ncbi:patatin-like phospholipase family protein [Aestuariimicrobium kwangyangense]|uniref:patatin-like phospholipase family protein n=1 Tax=Aestuariimicrobium kwangyangense TaxID=396389 RepID=UPI0003B6D086|nr:patatin-like phospholipase family protein [Aestuariimicrobium kwangyangense]